MNDSMEPREKTALKLAKDGADIPVDVMTKRLDGAEIMGDVWIRREVIQCLRKGSEVANDNDARRGCSRPLGLRGPLTPSAATQDLYLVPDGASYLSLDGNHGAPSFTVRR